MKFFFLSNDDDHSVCRLIPIRQTITRDCDIVKSQLHFCKSRSCSRVLFLPSGIQSVNTSLPTELDFHGKMFLERHFIVAFTALAVLLLITNLNVLKIQVVLSSLSA
ncbi:uncharacterized protein LOC105158482 [Sesamum indicum]|uniref:Uncharacterized protein LOC105158482 n=1 Tax=Sesamum indicum TaxID=4182 RepID=A0A6I9SVT7_SESIN|nr:uncharacterized protein LOC105158482 [Sesamum indicum]